MGKVTAIIVAAGSGSRMNSSVKKQYMLIDGKPLLYYTLKAFEKSEVDNIVLVTAEEDIAYCVMDILDRYAIQKVTHVVTGGSQRYQSVYSGLVYAEDSEYVLIHDGARPLITPELINENIRCVKEKKACVTAVPSKDTVKIADSEGFIKTTPDRKDVYIIQTPQSFEYDLIKGAYDLMLADSGAGITDDAMVVEKYTGTKVFLLEGDYRNIKVTTPEDIGLAELFLKA